MYLKSLELSGFKSFGKRESLDFEARVSSIVGPNGSGKSNIAEAFRFALGEQSIKSLRGKKGEDLIFNGGKNAPRANRASVKLTFNNERRLLNVDFDEVVLERVVHRDGVNQYLINGTQVRLRDVTELLAAANIGSSGHHIISQGEADRLLSASPKERREMIEDALGLRIYQFKLSESEKKLAKTRENIDHVEALRKEIAPHLRFLKKQVEKIEKTKELREALGGMYREYLKREEVYLTFHTERLKHARKGPEQELKELEREMEVARAVLEKEQSGTASSEQVLALETKLRALRVESEGLMREEAKREGEMAFYTRELESRKRAADADDARMVSLRELKELVVKMEDEARVGETVADLEQLRLKLRGIVQMVGSFVRERESRVGEGTHRQAELREALAQSKAAQEKLVAARGDLSKREKVLQGEYEALRHSLEAARVEGREAERKMFDVMSRQGVLQSQLQSLSEEERTLARRKELFENELKEAVVLVHRAILGFKDHQILDKEGAVLSNEAIAGEDGEVQEHRRRELERMKIRIEEMGSGSGEDVLREHREVEERDQFLAREIEDLEKSAASLAELIHELEVRLDTQFKEGMTKINKEFQDFFALMFGGGSASLSLVKEAKSLPDETDEVLEEADEAPIETGIEIAVSLPQKRIKGLIMLSGGERALTSIALLFAMSQVNPPPFLILDETDAALDEANSRRYGDMIENLSKYSQLILITHNRETMSRAQILYGVTMGGDGVSKVLSVKFEEAVAVAK